MLQEEYKKRASNKRFMILGVSLLVILVALLCLTWKTELSLLEGLAALYNYVVNQSVGTEKAAAQKVLLYLRIPRVCLAAFAGVGLSIAGLMMQSISRNFLVSPFTLGVSSAAAFGASICIVFGSATIFISDATIIGSAFLSSICSIMVVFTIAKRIGITANSIILVGIAMNYFFSALTASLQFFAQENKLAAVVQWTFGTFNRANWHAVLLVGIAVVFGYLIASTQTLKLNAIASGDDELVKSLGVNPQRLRTIVMLTSVFITACVISFTGVIGFVGLIAPHIARMLIGNDHRFLLPMAAGIGAALLVFADTLGKYIIYPVDVPVGIVVSFVGVPIFLHLIFNSKKNRLE